MRGRASAQGGPQAPLVVVSGGKGGVGATTVAGNLAVALARQGRRAVFVDADLDHGGHGLLGEPSQRGSVRDVLAGRRTVHEVLERGPSGVQVLCGQWAAGDFAEYPAAAQQRFINDLKQLGPHAEVVVIDAGSGRNHFVRRLWQAATAVVVVTTADSASIMESYAAIKVLLAGDASLPIHVLVNQTGDGAVAEDVQARIAAACRRFLGVRAVPCGHLPPADIASTGQGELVFSPRGDAAKSTDRVSALLWTHLQANKSRELGAGPPAALSA